MFKIEPIINYFESITNSRLISYEFKDRYNDYYKTSDSLKDFNLLYSNSEIINNSYLKNELIIQKSKNDSKFFLIEIKNYNHFLSIIQSFDFSYLIEFINQFKLINSRIPLFEDLTNINFQNNLFKYDDDNNTFIFNNIIQKLKFKFDLFDKKTTLLKMQLYFYKKDDDSIDPFVKIYFKTDSLNVFVIPLFKGNSTDYFQNLENVFKSIISNKINSILGKNFYIDKNTTKGEIIEHLNLCSIIKV